MVRLEVPKDELMNRMLERAKKEKRADDTHDVIQNRLTEYKNKTIPVVDFYREKNIYYAIDGFGSLDDVFNRIQNVVENTLKKEWLNVVLYGPPGSGKGTQGKMLAEKFNLVYISTGSLLRKEIKKESEIGKKVEGYMKKGDIVPDEFAIKLIEKQIKANPNASGFFFKGFPRTIVQAYILDGLLRKLNSSVSAVFNLNVSTLESIKRLSARAKTKYKRNYDVDTEIIINRLENFEQKTKPVLNYYKNHNIIYNIDGSGSEKEVSKKLSDSLKDALKNAR